MSPDYPILCKLILWGPAEVGKTSLIRPFSSEYLPTIGLEFALCKHSIANRAITCNIWDTPGQERFRSISASYPAGARGALLVYDVSRRDTFTQLPGILEVLRAKMRGKVMLVGNKVDLPREVDTVEGKEFAEKHDLLFLEVSAKTRQNVSRIVEELLTAIYETMDE